MTTKHLKSSPFLKDERQKTDASLNAERDKTNESLTKSKIKTELRTDEKLRGHRSLADQTTSDSRDRADHHSNEKTISNDQLIKERDRSDKAVELERSKVDIAIDKEREQKGVLANQVLELERKLTDKNLSAERTQTDTEVHRTTELLSKEVSEHSKTKISLTTKDEFLAIVSHDLKNPICAASMCAEMLLQDPQFRELGSKACISIELIKRNIDTSLRLIADLLDMERIERGKLKLALKNDDIGLILKEVIEGFAPMAAANSVELRLASPDFSGEVFCDKDRVTQVLSNLIGNSLKFTPNGGLVSICAAIDTGVVQVSVCDTGPGIPEEKRAQIFERYAQLGVDDRVGLGLGLYISKMLIEAMGGRLWVASKVGHGSTFNFTIPLYRLA